MSGKISSVIMNLVPEISPPLIFCLAAVKTDSGNVVTRLGTPASSTVAAKVDTLHDTRIPGVIQPQTGDSFARLGAPAGASVSADIDAIPTADETALAIVCRDVDTDAAAAAKQSVCTAVLALTSKQVDDAGNLKTYRKDGTTLILTQAITTDAAALPVKQLGVGA